MNYAELIVTALLALRGNILRTFLTMLGIIIGIASVILIVSLGQGATQSITAQISSFGTNNIIILPGNITQGGAQTAYVSRTLDMDDAKALANPALVQNVTAVSPIVSANFAVVADGQNARIAIQGVNENYANMSSIAIDSGSFLSDDQVLSNARVAVLGPDAVTDLFGEGADPIGKIIKIDSKSFYVIGVTQAKGSSGFTNPDKTVYIPVTTAMKELLGQNYVNNILIQADKPELIDQTVQQITDLLLQRHKINDPAAADFSVRTAKDALQTLGAVTGILTSLLAGIAAISLIVGGIGIMNIMLVTVTERTKEIGLLKAIGAKQRDILTQFLIESVVLTSLGGLVGMTVGILGAYGLTQLIHIPFVLQPSSVAISIGVSVVVGIVFGLYPARRAAKLSPIDALRYE